MWKVAASVSLLLFLGVAGPPQETQEKKEQTPTPHATTSDLKVPAEEANRQNPVKPTESSIREGRRYFTTQCAMCHGKDGDGKGDLAVDLSLNLRDWRDPEVQKKFTDGEFFYILSKGKGKMIGEEGRSKDEVRWHMINYIRSLAVKESAEKPKEQKPQ